MPGDVVRLQTTLAEQGITLQGYRSTPDILRTRFNYSLNAVGSYVSGDHSLRPSSNSS